MKQCWTINSLGAYQCRLGTLDKAIVLVKSDRGFGLMWRISKSSFLPFSDSQYDKPFHNPEECALYAEGIVLEWLNSLTQTTKELCNSQVS